MLRLRLRDVFGNHFADQEFLLDEQWASTRRLDERRHPLMPCSIVASK